MKIYDDSWIRYADTEDIFISENVVEIDNKQTLSNLDIFISRKGVDEDKITANKKVYLINTKKIILIYLIIFRNILIISFFQKLGLENIKVKYY